MLSEVCDASTEVVSISVEVDCHKYKFSRTCVYWKIKGFMVCFRESSDTLQCALSMLCTTSWKERTSALYYLHLTLGQGPLIFVVKI